ncbi:UNVERIFIED_CONTAM: putative membrane protein YczE [Brevibacillus sp. OAP136]
MGSVLGILIVILIICLLEVPSLLKKKQRRELLAFSVLLLVGTGLNIALALHIELPNPMDWIIAVYKPVSDMVDSLFK